MFLSATKDGNPIHSTFGISRENSAFPTPLLDE